MKNTKADMYDFNYRFKCYVCGNYVVNRYKTQEAPYHCVRCNITLSQNMVVSGLTSFQKDLYNQVKARAERGKRLGVNKPWKTQMDSTPRIEYHSTYSGRVKSLNPNMSNHAKDNQEVLT